MWAIRVLPGAGLALPGGAGTLTFGMDERAAQWAVATLADVREGWVCGSAWACGAAYEGLLLDALGDTATHPGLASITLARAASDRPSAVPVVLGDIDLFGYPCTESRTALTPPPGLHLARDLGYLTSLTLLPVTDR